VTLVPDGTPLPLAGEGIRRIGLVGRRVTPEVQAVMERVYRFAEEHDLTLLPEEGAAVGPLSDLERFPSTGEGVDLVLTLGGDGTLLRGVRRVAGRGVPVLGVNLGRLGFLTSVSPPFLEEALGKVLAGEALIDPRFTLAGRIVHGDGTEGDRLWALNDLVLHKGGVARVVRLDLRVGVGEAQEEIGSFSGDGLIVATPTGSTAYSLSAGGPIIVPTMDCIAVTPISPHTMAMRPLVLPDHVQLTIQAIDRWEELVVTADGQSGSPLGPGDRVVVEKGAEKVLLVRFPGQTYFDTLRRVLNWAV